MLRHTIAVFAVLCVASHARAQEAAPTPPRPIPSNLSLALNTVRWTQGPLLVVDAERTLPGQSRFDEESVPPIFPAPEPDGAVRLDAVAPIYRRQVMRIGGLSVLAPETMAVLSADLGVPNPFGSMRPDEKFALLIASLTTAQMRKLSGPNGLGFGDLDRDQQPLFRAMLPDPFRLQRTTYGEGGAKPEPPVTLSEAQRAAVRIAACRKLTWTFSPTTGQGVMGIGVAETEPGTRWEIPFEPGEFGLRSTAFGSPLVSELPNRLKQGDLALDAAALDGRVSTTGALTVGALIARVAEQSRVRLVADPRYGKLPVRFLGTPADVRGGDLLNALCLAVTGTFRKVGPIYIFTDDREGLGVRHARLNNWLFDAVIQSEVAKDRLRSRANRSAVPPGNLVDWDPNDPFYPGADIREQIETHRRGLLQPTPPSPAPIGFRDQRLPVPVSQLSPAAQRRVAAQIESWNRTSRESAPPPDLPPGFVVPRMVPRTDQVHLDPQIQMRFVVPGIGVVERSGSSSSGSLSLFQTDLLRPASPNAIAPASREPRVLPIDGWTNRAILVRPKTIDEVKAVVAAGKRIGLNQLWIGDVDAALMTEAVSVAKASGVSIVASVSLLRASENDPTSWGERTILGETAMELAKERLAALEPLHRLNSVPRTSEPGWFLLEQGRLRFRYGAEHGDWLRIDTPESAEPIRARVLALAAVPGIAGLAIHDSAPPGYVGSTSQSYSMRGGGATNVVRNLGYSLENRLAFLEKTDVDPIDLSLSGSFLPPSVSPGQFLEIGLPFFPDYGPDTGATYESNGIRQDRSGPSGGLKRWAGFLTEKNQAFMAELHGAIRAKSPDLPLFLRERSEEIAPNPFGDWFGSWDKADKLPLRKPITGGSRPSLLAEAMETSRRAMLTFTYDPVVMTPRVNENPDSSIRSASGAIVLPDYTKNVMTRFSIEKEPWDGYVLDLSRVSVSQAIEILSRFTPSGTTNP